MSFRQPGRNTGLSFGYPLASPPRASFQGSCEASPVRPKLLPTRPYPYGRAIHSPRAEA
jgi:hypothetical protein